MNVLERAKHSAVAPVPEGRTRVARMVAVLKADMLARLCAAGKPRPSIEELAERFGVSRPVVREAWRALAERGLVDIRHGDGTVARAPRVEALAEALSLLVSFAAKDRSTLLLSLIELRLVRDTAAIAPLVNAAGVRR